MVVFSRGGKWYDDLNNWLEEDDNSKAPVEEKSEIFDKGVGYKAPFRPLNSVSEEGTPTEKPKLDPSKIPEEEKPKGEKE